MSEIWDSIVQAAQQMSVLEIIGVVFGILSVWFSKKENILVYPSGIISVLIYVYLCFNVKLYADMGINVFYFIMSCYGWFNWSKKGAERQLAISINSVKHNIITLAFILGGWLALYFLLSNYTDSDVAWIDSLTTSLFFVGMWLMAWKKIENWILWIVGDLISVPLYWYKGLHLTSFQFLFFTALAISGYIEWKGKLQRA